MSRKEDDPPPRETDLPVTDRICNARMDALEEKINGIKTAIYVAGSLIIIILTLVQVALSYLHH